MLWNETVLEGNMFYCLPPPPETTPCGCPERCAQRAGPRRASRKNAKPSVALGRWMLPGEVSSKGEVSELKPPTSSSVILYQQSQDGVLSTEVRGAPVTSTHLVGTKHHPVL